MCGSQGFVHPGGHGVVNRSFSGTELQDMPMCSAGTNAVGVTHHLLIIFESTPWEETNVYKSAQKPLAGEHTVPRASLLLLFY